MVEIESRSGEFSAKLELVRALLRRRGDAAAVLQARRNFAWLTAGGDNHVLETSGIGVASVLVTHDDAVVLTGINEAARIREEELLGIPLEVVALPWERPEALGTEIRARVDGRVADDATLEEDLRPHRMRLTPGEQARLALLGARTSRAVAQTLGGARIGDLESVVAQRLATSLAADGIRAPVILVASDHRILRYRHPIPKPKAIEESLMLVVGSEQGGLIVAMTRMAWLRGRPDPETLRRFEAVTRVHGAFRAASRVGATLADVLAIGIAAYQAEGYADEWRLHHQGGPIGYQGREEIATPTSDVVIEGGMALAWNPSITGTKAEDTLILHDDGRQEIVTRDPDWVSDSQGEPAIWVRSS
jgi:Xaa-Pro aminopeptidase